MVRKRKTDQCGQYGLRGVSWGEAGNGLGGQPGPARPCLPWEVLPENCVHLLVGIEPKETIKPKMGRRKDLFLAASKANTRDLSQSSVC